MDVSGVPLLEREVWRGHSLGRSATKVLSGVKIILHYIRIAGTNEEGLPETKSFVTILLVSCSIRPF